MWIARAVAQLVLTASIVFVVAAAAPGLLAVYEQPTPRRGRRRSVACRECHLGSRSRPEEPTISRDAAFAISGLALIARGLVVG